MRGPGSDPMPRWLFILLVLFVVGLLWLAIAGLNSAVDNDRERKKAIVDVATKALTWGQALEQRVEALEAQIKELEERPTTVNKHVLNLKAVDTICSNGKRMFAVRYAKSDGAEGWFITPMVEAWGARNGDVRLQDCDGSEEVHPADRAKILEELKQ